VPTFADRGVLRAGEQCCLNGKHDTTSTKEQFFLVGLCRDYIWKIKTQANQ
jgi:hypothetical protein